MRERWVRYIGSQAGYIEELKQTGIIPARVGNGEHYFTISKLDNPTEAISKLQLNGEMTDAAWRAEFKIDQIKSSISFPYAKWGEARNVEVITRSYPQFGEGGAIQFITEGQIRLLRLVNIKTGEIVTF